MIRQVSNQWQIYADLSSRRRESGDFLEIRLGFHHHAPEQAAVLLAFHQQATNQVGGGQLGGAGEEGLGERWGVLGDGLGGYGSGLYMDPRT